VVLILSDLQSALALAPRSEASHLNLAVHLSRSEPVIDEKLGARNFYLERVRENRGTLKDKGLLAWRNFVVSLFVLPRVPPRREAHRDRAFHGVRRDAHRHAAPQQRVADLQHAAGSRAAAVRPGGASRARDSFMPEIAKLVARNDGKVFLPPPAHVPRCSQRGSATSCCPKPRRRCRRSSSAVTACSSISGPSGMDVGHFHNQDHMNVEGARRFTTIVAQILRESGALGAAVKDPEHIDFLRTFEIDATGKYVPVEPEIVYRDDPPPVPRADRPYSKGRGRLAVFQTETMGFLSDMATVEMTPYALRCSPLRVYEDGVALPYPNRSCDEVVKYGAGRMCHAADRIAFTASDDGNPFLNGKTYTHRPRSRTVV
jgi:hypothetical protein